jgi:lysophospholipase L1-like esterase
VFADFTNFVATVRTALPRARLAYISIAPNPARWAEVDKVRAANTLISDYVRHQRNMQFINVFPHMLGADGQPRPEIYGPDRLHMNEQGYALWKEIVKKYL